MSASVRGGGGPDIVNVLMVRKAMDAEKSNAAQLLDGLKKASPPPPPAAQPAPAARTWYL